MRTSSRFEVLRSPLHLGVLVPHLMTTHVSIGVTLIAGRNSVSVSPLASRTQSALPYEPWSDEQPSPAASRRPRPAAAEDAPAGAFQFQAAASVEAWHWSGSGCSSGRQIGACPFSSPPRSPVCGSYGHRWMVSDHLLRAVGVVNVATEIAMPACSHQRSHDDASCALGRRWPGDRPRSLGKPCASGRAIRGAWKLVRRA